MPQVSGVPTLLAEYQKGCPPPKKALHSSCDISSITVVCATERSNDVSESTNHPTTETHHIF